METRRRMNRKTVRRTAAPSATTIPRYAELSEFRLLESVVVLLGLSGEGEEKEFQFAMIHSR